jgi:hypothetical protein
VCHAVDVDLPDRLFREAEPGVQPRRRRHRPAVGHHHGERLRVRELRELPRQPSLGRHCGDPSRPRPHRLVGGVDDVDPQGEQDQDPAEREHGGHDHGGDQRDPQAQRDPVTPWKATAVVGHQGPSST